MIQLFTSPKPKLALARICILGSDVWVRGMQLLCIRLVMSGCMGSALSDACIKLFWSCSMAATLSMAPAAPRQCPTNDLVEFMVGKSLPFRFRAIAQLATSTGSAIVELRCPLMASIWWVCMLASAMAAFMQSCTAVELGAVMEPPIRCPPQFTAPPIISA